MKRSMKKFMTTCAAVTAIAAVASVSAMAAEYTAENNSVKYTVPAADADTQMTLLVIPEAAAEDVKDADILGINQDAVLADTALLKGESLADGTYLVKIGYYLNGEFAIANETFKVGDDTDDTDLVDVLLGNVAGSTAEINSADAQQVLKYSVTGAAAFAEDPYKLIAANVAGTTTEVNSADAQQILKYSIAGSVTTNVGKTAKVNANYEVVEIVD